MSPWTHTKGRSLALRVQTGRNPAPFTLQWSMFRRRACVCLVGTPGGLFGTLVNGGIEVSLSRDWFLAGNIHAPSPLSFRSPSGNLDHEYCLTQRDSCFLALAAVFFLPLPFPSSCSCRYISEQRARRRAPRSMSPTRSYACIGFDVFCLVKPPSSDHAK